MKVLHLYSDWRWTGPAEPTVNLCRALKEEGVEILFACRRPVEGHPQSILRRALDRGMEACTAFHLNRYLHLGETLRDLRSLPRFVDSEGIDLIHCHLTHDHFLGGWASRRSRRKPPVIRTNHKARPLARNLGNRWLLRRWTDGLVEFSRLAETEDRKVFSLDSHRVLRVNPALDLERFDPGRVERDVRGEIRSGLQTDHGFQK
jgi:glycosyltransferase involved in cell wall biosynthesis